MMLFSKVHTGFLESDLISKYGYAIKTEKLLKLYN